MRRLNAQKIRRVAEKVLPPLVLALVATAVAWVVFAQPTAPTAGHTHPELVSKADLWKMAATIVGSFVVIVLSAGIWLGRRDKSLALLEAGDLRQIADIVKIKEELARIRERLEPN